MKQFLVPFLLAFTLSASDQIVLVVAEDLDQSVGILQTFEKDQGYHRSRHTPFRVNLGRNGMAWGIGTQKLSYDKGPVKHEGDGRAPAGIFKLQQAFGKAPQIKSLIPYIQMREELICVDDAGSSAYNKIVPIDNTLEIRSFEWMLRKDAQYTLGVTVAHNPQQIPGRGSCIFLHVQKAVDTPTAGCTSMPIEKLKEIVAWLDAAKKPLLVQIPKSHCPEVTTLFPGVTCGTIDLGRQTD